MIKNYEDSKLNRLIELPQVIVNPEIFIILIKRWTHQTSLDQEK